jgi:hypothetical protein
MLYDVLLGLLGVDVSSTADTFDPDEQDEGGAFVTELVPQMGAAYLMANQIPMVGLAFADGSHTSAKGQRPFLFGTESAKIAPADKVPMVMISKAHGSVENTPLPFIAFSDQNDLLSWGIPSWYQERGDFINVYIKNSAHFGPVYADAAGAHTKYFKNWKDVWRAIRCGAENGKINPC